MLFCGTETKTNYYALKVENFDTSVRISDIMNTENAVLCTEDYEHTEQYCVWSIVTT